MPGNSEGCRTQTQVRHEQSELIYDDVTLEMVREVEPREAEKEERRDGTPEC